MTVTVRLHGALRDKLPQEARGQTQIDLPDRAIPLTDLLPRLVALGIGDFFEVAHNGMIVDDEAAIIRSGDRIDIFRPTAGG